MASNNLSKCCTMRPLRSLRYRTYSASTTARPPSAPKPMLDIKHIRQNPELYSQNCKNRNYTREASYPARIVQLFEKWQDLQREGRSIRERNNAVKTTIQRSKTPDAAGTGQRSKDFNRHEALVEARELKDKLRVIQENETKLMEEIESLAEALPNLTSEETPPGDTPRLLGYINEAKPLDENEDPAQRSHVLIGNELDLLNFTSATTTSGWGWYFLKNEAALLEQALVQYALSVAVRHGFQPVSPPSIVYSHIGSACGFRPRDQGGEQQIYNLQRDASAGDETSGSSSSSRPQLSLTGTAEIPLAAMHAGATLDAAALPLRVAGASRCFRAEAGSRGAGTRGLYRVHEFTKVELFGWALPDRASAAALFADVAAAQRAVLAGLGLRCRVLEQPAGDLGASALRKQDIEAFFPSRRDRDDGWGEVTSASLCTDYQTRRLATRLRGADGGKAGFPYTINGTALAVPRIIAAILENNWDSQSRSVSLPEVLWPWMHGIKEIRKKSG